MATIESTATTQMRGVSSQRSLEVSFANVSVAGRWLRIARIKDEDFCEGQVIPTGNFESLLRNSGIRADLFRFRQKPPAGQAGYDFHTEWYNLAVVETNSFQNWWEKELPQVTRKNVRRATRRGVVVRTVQCDDTLVEGITGIYNEIPIRDGRPFPHYGKTFDVIKREVTTMPDRSEFLGAYCGEELIGFIKLIHMGKLSTILHIVSKRAHYDKRPSNALLAAAVDACYRRGADYLIYGQYHYGKRSDGPLTEFKRRNGFKMIVMPQYFVPITVWGKVCLTFGLHHEIKELLPTRFLNAALSLRSKYYERRLNTFLSLNNATPAVGGSDMSD